MCCPWYYASPEQRDAACRRVVGFLNKPRRAAARQIVADLQILIAEEILSKAFKDAHRRHHDEATAAAEVRVYRQELAILMAHEEQAIRATVTTLMEWWLETVRTTTVTVPRLIEEFLPRAADQIAGTLVFNRYLPQRLSHQEAPELIWGVLLLRVAERVIVRSGVQDRIQRGLVVILSRAHRTAWTYRGMGPAVTFWRTAVRWSDRQPPQLPTASLSDPDAASGEPHRMGRTPSALDALDHQRRPHRSNVWALCQALLGDEQAIQLWMIDVLHDDHHLSYNEMRSARHVDGILASWRRLLHPDELPPDVTWAEVQAVFRTMAARATRPGILMDSALRQCHCRLWRTLVYRATTLRQVLLLAQQPWRSQPSLAYTVLRLVLRGLT